MIHFYLNLVFNLIIFSTKTFKRELVIDFKDILIHDQFKQYQKEKSPLESKIIFFCNF